TMMLLDSTTVVYANMDVIEEFLTANGQFELKSRMPADAGGAAAAAGGDQPQPAGRGGPPGRGDRGDAGPMNPAGGPQFTNRPTWLTIEPSLKSMMERLEDGEGVIAAVAEQLQADPKIADRVRESTGLKQLQVHGMNVLGIALHN